MRILITGGSGFIGSALGPRLLAEGHELFCVGRPGSAVSAGEAINWNGENALSEADFPKTIDAVIHLAQSRAFRDFPANAPEMFDINVRMTWALLQWASKVGARHFILASSGAVYDPFGRELREDEVLAPTGFLGATKFASEVLARPYAGRFQLSVLRLFFPYGPDQRDRLIPDLIRRVRTGRAVQVTQDGEGMRFTPTFIDDVVSIFIECLSKGWSGTFNIANPELISIGQIAGMIGRQLGISPVYERVDRPSLTISPDVGRLAGCFDVARFTRFQEGLRKTLVNAV